jgi:hypothetical protein
MPFATSKHYRRLTTIEGQCEDPAVFDTIPSTLTTEEARSFISGRYTEQMRDKFDKVIIGVLT